MKLNLSTIVKITLVILFFSCLAEMPYGYYQFVRFIGLLGFVLLAYDAYRQHKEAEAIVYGGLALLFQPFIKVPLGRQMWNIVDVVVGVGLIVSVLVKRKK